MFSGGVGDWWQIMQMAFVLIFQIHSPRRLLQIANLLKRVNIPFSVYFFKQSGPHWNIKKNRLHDDCIFT